MATKTKYVRASGKQSTLVHVETPLGIVNIRTNLKDVHGNRVDTIEFLPNDYSGEPKVTVDGSRVVRLIEQGAPK